MYWTDHNPGQNILHGQWSSPAIATLGGVPQVIFGGGDGWLYSLKADKGKDGKPELLWEFDANPKDTKWKSDLDKVESSIHAAGKIIEGGKNLMEAHELLEQVRYAFMALRKRNQMDYYLDHLSEFHEHMESITHTASERDAGSLSPKDKDHVGKELGQAGLIRERIQALRFDDVLDGSGGEAYPETFRGADLRRGGGGGATDSVA